MNQQKTNFFHNFRAIEKNSFKDEQIIFTNLLSRQQNTINALLQKYSDPSFEKEKFVEIGKKPPQSTRLFEQSFQKDKNYTIDKTSKKSNKIKQSNSLKIRSKINSTMNIGIKQQQPKQKQSIYSLASISLPKIKDKNNVSINLDNSLEKRNRKIKSKNEYSAYMRKERKKQQIQLYQIYGRNQGKDLNFSRSRSRSKSTSKMVATPRVTHSNKTNQEELPLGIPKSYQDIQQELLGEKQDQIQIESDDSDNNSDIDHIQSYHKQFTQNMATQCREELNFLFFTHNSRQPIDIKEWADSFLSLIEKHDKEIYSMRKKTKYLNKMNSKFFSFEI